MLENIAFFPTKRDKTTRLSTLKVGGGENLLRVPILLSGIVAIASWIHSYFDNVMMEFMIHNSTDA